MGVSGGNWAPMMTGEVIMIMYSLHPTQHFAPVLTTPAEMFECTHAMLRDGVAIRTATFPTPDGGHVAAFWSVDGNGVVATLWEHTYAVLNPNVAPADIEVRSVLLQTEDAVKYAQYDRDAEYAVGE